LRIWIAACIDRRAMRPHRSILIVVLASLALGLSACGSGTPKPVPSPAAPPAPGMPVPPPRPTPVPPPAPLRPPASLIKPVPVPTERVSLWTDQYLLAGWAIQGHFYTGQYRLVDRNGYIRAQAADYGGCKSALDYLAQRDQLKPNSPHLALLIHGLGSRPEIWSSMRKALARDGYEVATFTYPSTEQGVQVHGEALEKLLVNLDGYSDVTLVAHSLGGLVTRSALARPSFPLLRVPVRAVVMLGTPNQGATLASALGPLTRAFATSAGVDLTPERARQIGAIPAEVRFGVIAGGKNNRWGYNVLLAGDNDGVVRVPETRATNMDDFLLLPVSHTAMQYDGQVIAAVRRFLRAGTFRTPAAPAPRRAGTAPAG